MPFDLRHAAQKYQSFMDMVLHGLEFAYVHIDDVLVASSDEVKHKNQLTHIFDRFKNLGVFINPDKFVENGIQPLESKVSAVTDFPLPHSQRKL
uniref:Reverse transcriptase domain-containing protein n=1 Tax=Amphimedon queenslandica TaxID=400682 RepID=A0A1X7UCY5_AMPQE